jgi:hypothetical protein
MAENLKKVKMTAIHLFLLTGVFCFISFPYSLAQNSSSTPDEMELDDNYYDSLLNAYLEYDSLLLTELESDSLPFLDLLDQLMSLNYSSSLITLRAGYNSHVLNAGRDFGFKQYGFSGGLSYHNKTGVFLDITGYWNSEIEPNYNLTIASLGYMGALTPKWSLMGSYDHYFYNENNSDEQINYSLTNALNISSYYDLKWVSIGLDYGFLFGEESAHRIRPNLAGVVRFKDIGFIDRLSFMPGISGLWGNQMILVSTTNYQLVHQLIQKIGKRRFRLLYRYKPEVVESLILEDYAVENAFGLMNYSINLPLYMYIGKSGIAATYNLNFPVALPGEELDLSMNSYFGISASYTLYMK